ncbi:MAG: MerR family transcriptional regulator, partial [Acidobacteria bacterium]|nr:MerR family transcriptional regulator [Acidobacteriota bacterium]
MTDSTQSGAPDDQVATWSIRAVTLHTGVGEHTLRAWERRFGFPVPVRLPSGHRRYTAEQVRKIVRIRRALELGHRAGEVLLLDDAALDALLDESSTGSRPAEKVASETTVEQILSTVRRFDAATLRNMLERGAARSSTRTWINETIV